MCTPVVSLPRCSQKRPAKITRIRLSTKCPPTWSGQVEEEKSQNTSAILLNKTPAHHLVLLAVTVALALYSPTPPAPFCD